MFIVFLFSVSYISIVSTENPNNSDDQKKISENNDANLKSSAATVTSLINYSIANSIGSIEISADGNYIAASDGVVHNLVLFNKTSSKPMWNVTTTPISGIAMSWNGSYIAVAAQDCLLLYNNSYSNSKTPMWNYTVPLFGTIRDVAISEDGTYITASANNDYVYLLNNTYSSSKTVMWEFQTQDPTVNSVAISADGTYITAGGDDDTVYLLNNTYSSSKTEMWSYNTTSDIEAIDISADGKYISAAHSGSSGGNISYFDTNQKIRLWKYDHNPNYDVESVDMSADGKYMVSRGAGGFKAVTSTTGFFDNSIQSPKTSLWTYSLGNGYPKISDDGYYAAVAHSNNVTILDRTSSLAKEYTWSYEMNGIAFRVAISANGSHVIGSCSDNQVYLLYWDVPKHEIPPIGSSGGSSSDDDDEPPAIPFGNFYLLFSIIAVISLLVIMRRKLNLNKN